MIPVTPTPRPDAVPVVFAKDQPQYLQLPANVSFPYVDTKWQLSWRERWTVLTKGVLYLTIMNFGEDLQPVRLSVNEPKQ